jgi:hypothetical protein
MGRRWRDDELVEVVEDGAGEQLSEGPWSQPVDGLPVSDPVQLWLDCSSEGERALEAADTVAAVAGWS